MHIGHQLPLADYLAPVDSWRCKEKYIYLSFISFHAIMLVFRRPTMLELAFALLLVVLLTALAPYEHERQPGETRRDEDRPPERW